jgi:hypothetical protein
MAKAAGLPAAFFMAHPPRRYHIIGNLFCLLLSVRHVMPKSRSWGFPRWGGYGSETRPKTQRLCDREGCTAPGVHPAPKARQSDDKWWFCREHAAEYNRSWDYFAGMSYEDMRREAEEAAAADYAATSAYAYAAPALSREERRAYAILDLETTATAAEIKSRYRQLAKRYHPDANRDDAAAADKFHELQRAYEVLTQKMDAARRA